MNESVSIGLCTDTHLWLGGEHDRSEHGGLQLQGASEVLLATLVDELAAAKLDLVLHLGDLTCGGGGYAMPVDAFQATLDWIHAGFARLDTPVHAIPGNHDALPGAGGWGYVSQLWGLEPGLGLTIDLPAARLVLLNTHGHTPAQIAEAEECDPIWGWVSEQELARLDDALGTVGERPVLLFSHQLLQPWRGGDRWAELVRRSKR